MNTDNTSEEKNGDKYVDQRTKDVIREHLKDPNHQITEQDMKNVDTDMYNQPLPEDDEVKKELDQLPPKAPSAWEVRE